MTGVGGRVGGTVDGTGNGISVMTGAGGTVGGTMDETGIRGVTADGAETGSTGSGGT